jgi:hypothetical protein
VYDPKQEPHEFVAENREAALEKARAFFGLAADQLLVQEIAGARCTGSSGAPSWSRAARPQAAAAIRRATAVATAIAWRDRERAVATADRGGRGGRDRERGAGSRRSRRAAGSRRAIAIGIARSASSRRAGARTNRPSGR